MVELVSDILAKFGVPGIIISLLLIIVRINPITLISSSSLELKLSSKDKRFFIRLVRTVLEISLYVLFMLIITNQFFINKNLYNPYIAIILTLIFVGIFIWIFILDIQGKRFLDLVAKFHKWWQIFFYLLFLVHFVSYFVILSYYFGTQIFSEFYSGHLTTTEKLGVLLSVSVLYLFTISCTYFTIIKISYRFLGFSNISMNTHIIKKNNETWYLFHPIENELFLLGDKPLLNECEKFSIIEKSELISYTIELEKYG